MLDKIDLSLLERGILPLGALLNDIEAEITPVGILDREQRSSADFYRVNGVRGIMFQCWKLGTAAKKAKTSPKEQRVSVLHLNPSEFANYQAFASAVGTMINPYLWEELTFVRRMDYKVDVRHSMEEVLRGVHVPAVRRLEDYNLSSVTRYKHYVIGQTPNSLVVYNLGAKLRKLGMQAPDHELTRLEVRLSKKAIPSRMQQIRNLDDIHRHGREIVEGRFDPFAGRYFYVMQLPANEPLDMSLVHTRTPQDRKRFKELLNERSKIDELRGMMKYAPYQRLHSQLNKPGGRFHTLWNSLPRPSYPLSEQFRDECRSYFGLNDTQ